MPPSLWLLTLFLVRVYNEQLCGGVQTSGAQGREILPVKTDGDDVDSRDGNT